MKYVRAVAAVLVISPCVPVAAQDAAEENSRDDIVVEDPVTISGGVAGVTQYRFRGVSLSDEKPALQAWVEAAHEGGVYAGAWASSIDGFGEIGGSNVELDLYAGYRTALGGTVSLDVGAIYYIYPGAEGGPFDYIEPYAKLSAPVGPAEVSLGAAWAPAQDAIGGGDNLYLSADASLPIADTPVALVGHVGRTEGDSSLSFDGYTDWSLGAEATWRALTFAVSYVGTDIGADDAQRFGATRDIVDDAVVIGLTASF